MHVTLMVKSYDLPTSLGGTFNASIPTSILLEEFDSIEILSASSFLLTVQIILVYNMVYAHCIW